jgi:tetratricopeptide (TPR) repeat protein
MGNYAAAESLFKQSVTIWKKAVGKEDRDYASTLNNLAELYRTMRNYNDAQPLYLQSLAITKKVLGADHPDYARSLNTWRFFMMTRATMLLQNLCTGRHRLSIKKH